MHTIRMKFIKSDVTPLSICIFTFVYVCYVCACTVWKYPTKARINNHKFITVDINQLNYMPNTSRKTRATKVGAYMRACAEWEKGEARQTKKSIDMCTCVRAAMKVANEKRKKKKMKESRVKANGEYVVWCGTPEQKRTAAGEMLLNIKWIERTTKTIMK